MKKQLIPPFLIALLLFSYNAEAQLFAGNDFFANTIRPPELYLNTAKKVAVLNFKDENNSSVNYWNETKDNGARLADNIVSNLLQSEYGLEKSKAIYITGFRTNIFTVVERSQLDNVLKEQKLGASGAIDDSEASTAGKLLGIDVIISGSVSHTHKDSKSNYSTKDSKTDKVTTYYKVLREVNCEARVKFIQVSTGQVLAVHTFKSTAKDSRTEKSPLSYDVLQPVDRLADKGFSVLANEVMSYMTPVYQYQRLDIWRVKNKEYKEKAKEAVDHMQDGRIDRALLIYNSLYELDPYNQEVANNIGVIYEGTANFDKALEYYNIALQIAPDDKTLKESVKRAEKGIKLKSFLAEYDIEVKPYEFAEAGSGSSKLADKVTTKGKTKDRLDVYAMPSNGSAVVAKVPGDTQFEVIEKESGWFKIKLLGGKEGYIEAGSVKE